MEVLHTTSTAMKAPITTDILTEYMRQKGKWESFDNFVKWNYGKKHTVNNKQPATG